MCEIIEKVERWTLEDFWFKRDQINHTLLRLNILEEIIQEYLVKEPERASHHRLHSEKIKFCEMGLKTMRKVKIVLAIYEYFAELDLNKERLPTMREIIYDFEEEKKFKLAEFLLTNLDLANTALLE